jgi:hypothetical protein
VWRVLVCCTFLRVCFLRKACGVCSHLHHPARLQPLHARLLLAFQLGHGGSAWGGVQQPKARVVLPGRCCVAPRVCHALISWHAHANDCCRLPYRRTRHAVWRGSPRRPLLGFPTQWCREAEMGFRRLQCRAVLALIGCRVNVSPPGGTLCRAVATYCTVLQRVPRLEALLRVSTLHECLKESRPRAERKLQGQWPKVLRVERIPKQAVRSWLILGPSVGQPGICPPVNMAGYGCPRHARLPAKLPPHLRALPANSTYLDS